VNKLHANVNYDKTFQMVHFKEGELNSTKFSCLKYEEILKGSFVD